MVSTVRTARVVLAPKPYQTKNQYEKVPGAIGEGRALQDLRFLVLRKTVKKQVSS